MCFLVVKFGETEKPHPTGAPHKYWRCGLLKRGAGDETRTRDINLGKVALYQLSYTRRVEDSSTVSLEARQSFFKKIQHAAD